MNIPKLVAVLNITPDSFTDGGSFVDEQNAIEQTKLLIKQGADVIDIGAESTRPNATELNHDQEWQRLQNILPEIINLTKQHKTLSSIDTRHAQTAKKAIKLGIDIINDVNSLNDKQMISTIVNSNVDVVFMHSLTIPADKNILMPPNVDVVDELLRWAENKIKLLNKEGIVTNRLIFDPGIGFGKSAKQSMQIIQEIDRFNRLDCKIFVGHSRKSFLELINKTEASQRDIETVATSMFLINKKVDFLRVHNVDMHKRAFETFKYLNS